MFPFARNFFKRSRSLEFVTFRRYEVNLKQDEAIQGRRAPRRNLVVSRVGIGHKLQGILGVKRTARSWDLALSIYDDCEFLESDCIDFVHHYKGGKWDGIHAFFVKNPDLLNDYDYFWLVDDDIEATASQVDELFAYVEAHGFEIAQPALTPNSFHSHRLTLQCPLFNHRLTNFVELMMPVLSKAVLKQVLPFCKNTQSGLGLDWLWNRFVSRPAESIAIIDAIAMPHQRPRNQHLRGRMEKEGISALEERRLAIQDWNLNRIYPVAFYGKLMNGTLVKSRLGMSYLMTKAYWTQRHEIIRPSWPMSRILLFSLRQTFSKL